MLRCRCGVGVFNGIRVDGGISKRRVDCISWGGGAQTLTGPSGGESLDMEFLGEGVITLCAGLSGS